MEKSCTKCAPKASPRPLFTSGLVSQNSHYMQEIILKIRYFERELPKKRQKVNFIFSSRPSPF